MKKWKWAVGLVFFLLFGPLVLRGAEDIREDASFAEKRLQKALLEQAQRLYQPLLQYGGKEDRSLAGQLLLAIEKDIPFYYFQQEKEVISFEEIQQEQYHQEELQDLSQKALEEAVLAENRQQEQKKEEIPAQENQPPVKEPVTTTGFVPEKQKKLSYLPSQLADVDFIKKNFYTEDATTRVRPEQISYDTLIGYDAALKQGAQAPQILVYHTHSQETYIDSNPQDASTTIMGVGEYLCAILREEYGFHVIHHMGMYDIDRRDDAYAKAAVGLEQVLAENPSVEVIIDLHRDAVKEGRKLETNIQGQNMAQFMFFNGLCYTRARGELTSLPNPYVQENLAFAFQMKLAADEYYPGLARKTYLKGYRYNLQYRPKSLLIELGAQTNTVEEAMNACRPLAHVIAMVLRGEKTAVQ